MLQRSKPARSSRRSATRRVATTEDLAPADAATAPDAIVTEPGFDSEAEGVGDADQVSGVAAEDPGGVAARGADATPTDHAAVTVPVAIPPSGSMLPTAPEVSPGPTLPAMTADRPDSAQGGTRVPAPAPAAAVPATSPPMTTARTAHTLMENTMQQANKATETMMKAAEEAAEFGRGNVEAITKATQIYVAGMQDLGKQTFAVMQGLTDHAIEGAKALSGVKSLHEAAQIQSNFARAALEKSVTETAKLGEQALKLTEQAFAPLTARFTVATEKLSRAPIAA